MTPPVLSIIVPVYNEAETISQVLTLLSQLPLSTQIIVVDDASTDATPQRIAAHPTAAQCTVLRHPRNRGKGAAIRSALPVVRGSVLVIQDADLEYNPEELVGMYAAIEAGADIVYGTRFGRYRPQGMLLTHYCANRLLTWWFNRLYGTALTDLETCYKMCRVSTLMAVTLDHDRFDIDPELTAKWVAQGYTIAEVPVHYLGRPYRAGKKIRPIDAWSALVTMWRYRAAGRP